MWMCGVSIGGVENLEIPVPAPFTSYAAVIPVLVSQQHHDRKGRWEAGASARVPVYVTGTVYCMIPKDGDYRRVPLTI